MEIPIIPGRGLVTSTATNMRLDFLTANAIETNVISETRLEYQDIRGNIESYIGSTEIPLGIVGPLLFNDNGTQELTYCTAGTLEGALIASMNRGAKVISKSNGFSAEVKWQKMTRSPMFIFEKAKEATIFKHYIKDTFSNIKAAAEAHSNHGKLIEIDCIQDATVVHAKFSYETGDASGQNMTTTCTWHAMLYLVEAFTKATGIVPVDFVIEGNGACDKKVSQYNIDSGRGIHVVAECTIPEEIITKVLRTTSEKLMRCFHPSKKLAAKDGMVGYNINVANAIAAIFVATGQDLASIHESSVGILHLAQKNGGLYMQLTLPNLVIGSIGGGTSLPRQAQALEIMDCYGSGKVNRFAKLIAGFALGLEISTYSAIVSGEFAKAHEKLGRNKPVQWLLPSEVTSNFVQSSLNGFFEDKQIQNIQPKSHDVLENGILTNIASKVNKKIIGFLPFQIDYTQQNGKAQTKDVLIKSKPLDDEVIKGLHTIAASINPELSDVLKKSKRHLEYHNCHLKEIEVYSYLHKNGFENMPKYFGKHVNPKREIFMLIQEFLPVEEMKIMNSENHPECWKPGDIISVLKTITKFHQYTNVTDFSHVPEFKPWNAAALYKKMMQILIAECATEKDQFTLQKLLNEIDDLQYQASKISIEKTIIHNDFNPRNIAIRKDDVPVIYDWELAVIDFPQRDIVEFLSFTLLPNFKKDELYFYLKTQYQMYDGVGWNEWLKACRYSLKVYIITRLSFYEVSGILIAYDFSKRVLQTALQMLTYLEADA
ncbi:phosphotransferase [uncultured Kordia sp.]|uniref:phosphotransferase n=1 Tax=uncultured Kordia sp. TaxID=507699 RepID=UPI0026040323|nr:phosphotransferase [uncultured Kordia sp.]